MGPRKSKFLQDQNFHFFTFLFGKILKVTAVSIWFPRGTLPSLLHAEVGIDKLSDKISSPSSLFSPSTTGQASIYTTFLAVEKHLVRIPYK